MYLTFFSVVIFFNNEKLSYNMKLAVKNAWKTRERKTVVSFRKDLDTTYKVKEKIKTVKLFKKLSLT